MRYGSLILAAAGIAVANADIDRGLTDHFSNWLKDNNYGQWGFERTDLQGGAYGGKSSDSDVIKNQPVVFFHGNSDIAVGLNPWQTGFTKSIEYFEAKGYTKGELYITTWGPGSKSETANQTHNKDYLTYLRAFTEAVLEYTGAEQIDIISHSMGVTLGRKVLKGGRVAGQTEEFDLGKPLTDKVDTFVGIAGGNWGLANCYAA